MEILEVDQNYAVGAFNVEMTKQAVEIGHKHGATVEGELGAKEYNPIKMLNYVRGEVQKMACGFIKIFGSSGKAIQKEG